MITEVLPCERDEAIELLQEAEEWLYRRAKLSAAIGLIATIVSIVVSIFGPIGLVILGVASAIIIAGVTVWLYRGNKNLGDDVCSFKTDLENGVVNIQDYCELPIVTAVVAYKLKRTGKLAGESQGRGWRVKAYVKRYKHPIP